jgi:NAD(P)-dependent dehydrogenase (short-subunit alcohol dehydrogenase family)
VTIDLIYGGTGGIGSALARRLAAAGRKMHLVARDGDRLAALAAELNATCTQGDVADPAVFARATADAGGPIEALVYAVGTINLKPIGRLTDADFERDFAVNALGAARAVRAALPAMKDARAPSILLFSTVAVAHGFAAHASVSMAKGAVEGLTRALAAELAPRVRVNAIAPSLTKTPLAGAMTSNEAMAKALAGLHPLGRLGEADDVAALGAFLVSDTAGWITGQVMAVDGGRGALKGKA